MYMIKNLRDRVLLANPVALVVAAAVSVGALAAIFTITGVVSSALRPVIDFIRTHAFELTQVSIVGMTVGFLMIAMAIPHLVRGQR
jgi:uncharacterized oligopeptide transporter (OPT) family protein